MGIQRATKKPVTIEFVQWNGANVEEIADFVGAKGLLRNFTLVIKTLEGEHIASEGDYIIKGIKGEFYPCKPDIFAMTYNIGDAPDHEATVRALSGALEQIRKEPNRVVIYRIADAALAGLQKGEQG